ncbi:ComEC/Rec2 family competence protein [Mesoplasma tabanidae]|uniref:DNA uptake protein n=1 Tax=Mesoplasma tabanidae TaxID=219745 RepID=A0A2K8P396_9MOLU|nr:MBL fold metallo-hydrolase [Mesoplasma tabanidae]ATZ21234.1 DNA uptake protein [Mesoplasma tabanidae]
MKKKINLVFLSLILALVGFLSIITVSCASKIKEITGNVSFYVLSIGSGNFTFLEKDGHAVVMDCGTGLNSGGDSLETETDALNTGYWGNYANKTDADNIINFMKNTANVKVIDAIFISHKHTDHYNTLKYLVESFEVGTIVAPTDSKGLETAVKQWKPSGNTIVDTIFSKTYDFLGGTFENLTAYSSKKVVKSLYTNTDPNAVSMVLRFKVNGEVFMLPGDMEDNTAVIRDSKFRKAAASQKVDVFLLPHHGSQNGATDLIPLIGNKEKSPKHVIISGTDNLNGFEPWAAKRNAITNAQGPIGMLLNTYSKDKREYIHITGAVNYNVLNEFGDHVDKENTESTFEYKFSEGIWNFVVHEENIANGFRVK